jgi:hypothetical protein
MKLSALRSIDISFLSRTSKVVGKVDCIWYKGVTLYTDQIWTLAASCHAHAHTDTCLWSGVSVEKVLPVLHCINILSINTQHFLDMLLVQPVSITATPPFWKVISYGTCLCPFSSYWERKVLRLRGCSRFLTLLTEDNLGFHAENLS